MYNMEKVNLTADNVHMITPGNTHTDSQGYTRIRLRRVLQQV